jgi:4-hydroxy-2-oxoheptanedioate aldolase
MNPRPALVRPNRAKAALGRGRPIFGPNLQIPSPDLVEIIALAGFDFVVLDGEHGSVWTRLPELLVACDAAAITSIVRVPSHERSVLLPPLEAGALGLQVPFVNTPEAAQAIVREVKFPPLGGRGFSTVTRAARHGFVAGEGYPRAANRSTLLVVQLETAEAIANAEAIARVRGVDLIFIGPADLAQSLGHRADQPSPAVTDLIVKTIRRVAPIKPVSVSAFNPEDVARWQKAGALCFLTSSAAPLRAAFRQTRERLHSGWKV